MARNRKINPTRKKIHLSTSERDMLNDILVHFKNIYPNTRITRPNSTFTKGNTSVELPGTSDPIIIDDPIIGAPPGESIDYPGDYADPGDEDGYRESCSDTASLQYESESPSSNTAYDECDNWFRDEYGEDYVGAGQGENTWIIQSGCCYNLLGQTLYQQPGDMNGDGTVNVQDIIVVIQWILNETPPPEPYAYIPPYNEEGGGPPYMPGCQDETACNYNPYANNPPNDPSNACWYAPTYRDCQGNCINDADLDGICDEEDAFPDCGTWLDQCNVCEGPGPQISCWDGSIVCDESDCPGGDPDNYCDDTQACNVIFNSGQPVEEPCKYLDCGGILGVPDMANCSMQGTDSVQITTCLYGTDAPAQDQCVSIAVYTAALNSGVVNDKFSCEVMPQYGYSSSGDTWLTNWLNTTHYYQTIRPDLWDNGNIIGCQDGIGIDLCGVCGGDSSTCNDCSGYCCLDAAGCTSELGLGSVNQNQCVNGLGHGTFACTDDSDCPGEPGGGGIIDDCGMCSTTDYGGCGAPNCSCTGCLEAEAINYNQCYIWEGHTDGVCDYPCIDCCDFNLYTALPFDYIQGGGSHPVDLTSRQYIGFSLPPKCGTRFGLDECTDEFLMCSNDRDNEASIGSCNGLTEYATCGNGGVCVQYPIDYMLKTSIFSSQPDDTSTPNASVLSVNDMLYTNQYNDNASGDSYGNFITFKSQGSFGLGYNGWFDNGGVMIEFEPGKGYWLQVVNNMWLWWQNPYQMMTFSTGGGMCAEGYVELWGYCYDIETTMHLDLSGSGLTGEIPPAIAQLTNLQTLQLQNNQLTGEIPVEIGNMTNLNTRLWLHNNQLTGEIPSSIGNLIDLRYLRLDSNQLTGQIPPEIGQLTNLSSFWLKNNQLTGDIPQEVCNIIPISSDGTPNMNFILEGNNLNNTCEEGVI